MMDAGIRLILIVLLVTVMVWGWVRGEAAIRSDRAPVQKFSALWRLLMVSATVVATITAVALWTAQGASGTAEDVARENRRIAVDLCIQNREWQNAAIDIRRADVRIADAERLDAQAQLTDARAALSEARRLGLYDRQPFVASFLERELARSRDRLSSLSDEYNRRSATLGELEAIVLDECPPSPSD